jgi:hypothetical protein
MTIQKALMGFFLAGVLLAPVMPSQTLSLGAAYGQEAPAAGVEKAKPIDLAMSRAVLYSSGVAYFEHEVKVTGDATAVLPFKTDQINDILKSMVVLDDSGKPATVTYPSNDPIARSLKSFGVDISGKPSISQILGQLQGVGVRLMAPEAIEGKVLSVDEQVRVVGNPPVQITDHIVSVVTADGIKSVPLSTVSNITILDKRLQEELVKALALVATSRDTERKPVTIHLKGEGTRTVRVGYLLEAPVWKSTYRLDLTDKPLLQGWALVENTSDNDWNKVGLSLVSGRPISFQMDMYTPLYLERPVVAPQYFQFLRPRLSEAGIAEDEKAMQLRSASGAGGMGPGIYADAMAAKEASARPAAAPMMAAKRIGGNEKAKDQANGYGMQDAETKRQQLDKMEVTTQGGQMGELFKYTLPDPVTMPRRQSAMLALLSKPIKAQKVSVYNAQVLAGSPLSGVRLTNDTGMKLLTGPVTIFDSGAYAGDAQIDNLSENDSRLITYGVDLSVKVDSSMTGSQEMTYIKIVKGVLEIARKQTYSQEYKIKNNAEKDRLVVVEHNRDHSRTLVEPAKADETTPNYLRFNVNVPAGKTGVFKVVEDQPLYESVALMNTSSSYLEYHVKNSKISAKVKEALIKAMQMRAELTELERMNNQLAQEVNTISQEQNRLRQNIASVGAQSQLGQRYTKKLGEQEDRIEAINTEVKARQEQINAKRKAMEDYLTSLTLD